MRRWLLILMVSLPLVWASAGARADVLATACFPDPAQKLTLDLIAQQEFDPDLCPGGDYVDGAMWVRVVLDNASAEPVQGVLDTQDSFSRRVTIYSAQADGLAMEVDAGTWRDVRTNFLGARSVAVPLTLAPDARTTIYYRVLSPVSVYLSPRWFTLDEFVAHHRLQQTLMSLFYGVLLGLLIYNGFLAATSKELVYFCYTLFLCATLFMHGLMDGSLFRFWPDPWWTAGKLSLFWPAVLVQAISFYSLSWCFLKPGVFSVRVIQLALTINLLLLLLCFTQNWPLVRDITQVVSFVFNVYLLALAVHMVRTGSRPAKIYFIAFSGFVLSQLLTVVLASSASIPQFWLECLLMLGCLWQVQLLSLGLGDQLNSLKAENQRIQLEAEAATAAAAFKSRFLANMSHEIRTPMNGVVGMADLLATTSLDKEQTKYVHTIQSSGNILLKVINDVLDLAKIEEGGIELSLEPVNLHTLMTDIRQLFNYRALELGLDFSLSIKKNVPSFVLLDTARLMQVLINLVGNAFKFTRQGGVEISLGVESSDLYFSVRDTGSGIEADALAHIFEPFRQVKSAPTAPLRDHKQGGTGLGLAISQQLVDIMGGTMGVESVLGEGSCFWFRLPCVQVSPLHRDQSEPSTTQTSPPLRVLVAEDNSTNRLVIGSMLEKLGHTAMFANDGEQAFNFYRQEGAPDLILMDYEMPRLSGVDATRAIRQWEQQQGLAACPIYALTAHALPEHHHACLQAGMECVLNKPLQIDELRRVLATLSGRKQIAASEVQTSV